MTDPRLVKPASRTTTAASAARTERRPPPTTSCAARRGVSGAGARGRDALDDGHRARTRGRARDEPRRSAAGSRFGATDAMALAARCRSPFTPTRAAAAGARRPSSISASATSSSTSLLLALMIHWDPMPGHAHHARHFVDRRGAADVCRPGAEHAVEDPGGRARRGLDESPVHARRARPRHLAVRVGRRRAPDARTRLPAAAPVAVVIAHVVTSLGHRSRGRARWAVTNSARCSAGAAWVRSTGPRIACWRARRRSS